MIRDCRVGYRTFGTLNADKSNVVLFPTWAGGTTEQLKSNIGPGRVVNSEKFFVVAVDALGNGVSSSPSNSTLQPRMSFPKFTIRDSVNTQHELLTKVLQINHLKAVVGVSMGGMQTAQITLANLDKFSHIGTFSSGGIGDPKTAGNGVMANATAFNDQVKVLFISVGTSENPANVKRNHEALDEAGIHNVYYESPGTAHEWLTWRRSLHEFAPLLFQN